MGLTQISTAGVKDDAVTASKLPADAVGASEIAANAVGSSELADDAVDTAAIAADAVTGAKIADDAIDSEHYTDGSIDTAHIADSQVTTAKIAADAITAAKIADDVINSEHIAAGAIDLEHMSSESVDEDNLQISNAGSNGQFLSKQSGNTGGLTWADAGGGKILQVVSTTKTDTFSATTEDTWTDITGLSVAITPSATSSKILFRAMVHVGTNVSDAIPALRVLRDSTAIGIGDASNNRGRATAAMNVAEDWLAEAVPIDIVDSPSSTSALTYKVQYYKSQSPTIYINQSYRDYDGTGYDYRYSSVVYVMEIGA